MPDLHMEDGSGADIAAVGGVILFFAVSLACCCTCCHRCSSLCCWRCRRTRVEEKLLELKCLEMPRLTETLKEEHLIAPKNLCVAIACWAFGGIIGAHHFYLERLVHGVLAFVTLNFFLVGWWFDIFLLPTFYVPSFNRGASQYATQRWGFGSLCCLGALMMSIPFINCYAVAQVPRILHHLGVFDLDARLAQTEPYNPYDLLHFPRGIEVDPIEARKRHADQVKMLNAQGPCGAVCKQRKGNLQNAMQYLTGEWVLLRRIKESKDKDKPNLHVQDGNNGILEKFQITTYELSETADELKARATNLTAWLQDWLNGASASDGSIEEEQQEL